jgi:L-aspartate oxidase
MTPSSRSAAPVAPVVIVGAGLAGLAVALRVAQDRKVVVLAKRQLDEGATAWAQGGIVGVLGDDDSVDSHVRDTQDAGAGLVDEHTARFIAERSAQAVEWLVAQGVPFSADPSGPLGLHLTREGGMRCGASPMPPTPPARPSMTRCWPRRVRTRTSACASAGWRWT